MATKKVAETFPDFQALLTKQQAHTIEKTAHGFDVNRRVMLACAQRSREQLLTGCDSPDETGEALMMMEECADAYVKHLSGMLEMARCAQARIHVTLQTMVDRRMVAP